MVNILTGVPFDAPKRLHHREDEGALEFSSSVSSRSRGLLALKAFNWRTVKKSAPTARDYVQDGLVMHFDAIENRAYGERDTAITSWYDLVGGVELKRYYVDPVWGETSVKTTGGWNAARIDFGLVDMTMECLSSKTTGYSIAMGNNTRLELNPSFNGRFFLGNANVVGNGTNVSRWSPWTNDDVISSRGFVARLSSGVLTLSLVGVAVDPIVQSGVTFQSGQVAWTPFRQYGQTVDEYMAMRVYSRALTDAEVAANYAVDKARFGVA